jgi:(2R)-3-sulfolactate dehydrogenase (NADP+)
MKTFDAAQALAFAHAACRGAGAGEATSAALARATVAAELQGKPVVGFRHLLDYLKSFDEGRIARDATPVISHPAPTMIQVDAGGGIAQLGFDLAFADLGQRAASLGVAIFALRDSYPAGELGYYVRRLAETGLVALAATNGPALAAPPGARGRVYCTNPIAFAAPVADGPPLVIDQATTATAFVNVRERAERGESLPPGWAVDAQGRETLDAGAALKGALLTFGGARGANIALMVEVLAAGLTDASWSLDAPSFLAGPRGPGIGLFVLALAPALLAPDFAQRMARQCEALAERGVHIPNRSGKAPLTEVRLPEPLCAAIEVYASRSGVGTR